MRIHFVPLAEFGTKETRTKNPKGKAKCYRVTIPKPWPPPSPEPSHRLWRPHLLGCASSNHHHLHFPLLPCRLFLTHSLQLHFPFSPLQNPFPHCRFKFPIPTTPRLLRVHCGNSSVEVRDVSYQPPGTQLRLLNSVNFSLPERSFGLIFGQSGSGKTTLLQLLAGISKPTSGSIYTQKYGDDGIRSQPPEPLVPERVGIVFQFPERYFVADNVLDEVTFGWPRQKGDHQLRENLALGLQRAINWVGLSGISLDKNPHSLSGGYKRRLALAIQLVQIPDLLILDEPLAGLDWKARADVVKLLKHLKKELTVLVVSHDLRELQA